MTATQDLLERLEKASCGNRELDRAIYEMLLSEGFVPDRSHDPYPGYRFTSSVDASMMLIPTSEHWQDGEVSYSLETDCGKWAADFTCLKARAPQHE